MRPTSVIRVHREFRDLVEIMAKERNISIQDATLLIANDVKKKRPYSDFIL